jgi:ABC-type multidrug transport system ATPase subunit
MNDRHRLSTIMQSDRILVVIDGEIVEEGSHNELIYAQGKYYDLWSKQVFVEPGAEEPKPGTSQPADCILINDLDFDENVMALANSVGVVEGIEQTEKDESNVMTAGQEPENNCSYKHEVGDTPE